jgi:hypothetical protein
MPTLTFEGDTHEELTLKVRRWLESTDGATHLTASEAVERAGEITKDALQVIASAAPAQIASSDVIKELTRRGHGATDKTTRAVLSGLNALSDVTNGGLVKRVEGARKTVVYEMNATVAKQLLKTLRR